MQKERKTLVMRVGKSHEGFMFDTKAPLGSKEFKPKIPSVSEDNYLRKTSGNSSARPGSRAGYRGEQQVQQTNNQQPTTEEKNCQNSVNASEHPIRVVDSGDTIWCPLVD